MALEHPNCTKLLARLDVAEEGPPSHFEAPHDMLQAVYDACQENRLLCGGGKSTLNEVDLTHRISEYSNRPLGLERTRSWPFTSVALLWDPLKAHDVQDDLESFYWVMLYLGLVHLPYTSIWPLSTWLQNIFYAYSFPEPDGVARGGDGKCAVLHGYHIGIRTTDDFAFSNCPPLTKFVKDMALELYQWQRDDLYEYLKDHGHSYAWLDTWQPVEKNHKRIDRFFEEALDAPDWPKNNRNQLVKTAGHRVSVRKRSRRDVPEPDDIARRSHKKAKQPQLSSTHRRSGKKGGKSRRRRRRH